MERAPYGAASVRSTKPQAAAANRTVAQMPPDLPRLGCRVPQAGRSGVTEPAGLWPAPGPPCRGASEGAGGGERS
eukprot:758080-Hanusia_phi.AAC.8